MELLEHRVGVPGYCGALHERTGLVVPSSRVATFGGYLQRRREAPILTP